ncbi:hypothetical protein KIMH_06620 [Bombiscardovia apis]|uniref:PH domain-containing protein n=1 Tax=Bombiscardovia apis TaxID=2932182 RepID=A0ABM8BCC0_9BIFI|nr:hypothetical protein [Bombiscardovia apis]BDR54551.1 hypothetical protein KIMH_06620 [Bombiscardovia apis]
MVEQMESEAGDLAWVQALQMAVEETFLIDDSREAFEHLVKRFAEADLLFELNEGEDSAYLYIPKHPGNRCPEQL